MYELSRIQLTCNLYLDNHKIKLYDQALLIDREGKQRLEEAFTKGASDEKIITANSSLFR